MRTPLIIFIGCLGLLVSSYSFGDCGGSNGDQSDCQQSSCVESQNYCQCADINSGRNPCINKNDYCRYFGNVGDSKLTDTF